MRINLGPSKWCSECAKGNCNDCKDVWTIAVEDIRIATTQTFDDRGYVVTVQRPVAHTVFKDKTCECECIYLRQIVKAMHPKKADFIERIFLRTESKWLKPPPPSQSQQTIDFITEMKRRKGR